MLVALVVVAVVLPLLALVVDLGLTRTLSARSRGASTPPRSRRRPSARPLRDDPSTAAAIDDAKALVAVNMPAPDGGWPAAWASCVDAGPLPEGTAAAPGDCISFDYALSRSASRSPGAAVPSVFAGVFGTSPPAARDLDGHVGRQDLPRRRKLCASASPVVHLGGPARPRERR